jgi:prepilin peptidase CpaA
MPIPLYIFILIQLLVVSIEDIRSKKVHHVWPILNLLVYALICFIYPEYYHFVWQTFIYSTVFLIVGFGLFLLRIMGGGDSKYLFSFFILIPMSQQDSAFHYLVISTVAIGMSVFIMNLTRNFNQIKQCLEKREFENLKHYFGTKFSFAPVILVTWMLLGWDLKIIQKFF